MPVPDLSPTAPITTNAAGGKQSDPGCRLDLVDGHAMLALGGVLDYGAKKYEPDNWRKIPASDHINHMLIHAFAWLSGDTQDDHLGHMLCRAMMAHATAHKPPRPLRKKKARR